MALSCSNAHHDEAEMAIAAISSLGGSALARRVLRKHQSLLSAENPVAHSQGDGGTRPSLALVYLCVPINNA